MKTSNVLQAKHASDDSVTWGVDGIKGTITDMKDRGVWEPLSVKLQTYKTAIEVWHFSKVCVVIKLSARMCKRVTVVCLCVCVYVLPL